MLGLMRGKQPIQGECEVGVSAKKDKTISTLFGVYFAGSDQTDNHNNNIKFGQHSGIMKQNVYYILSLGM